VYHPCCLENSYDSCIIRVLQGFNKLPVLTHQFSIVHSHMHAILICHQYFIYIGIQEAALPNSNLLNFETKCVKRMLKVQIIHLSNCLPGLFQTIHNLCYIIIKKIMLQQFEQYQTCLISQHS